MCFWITTAIVLILAIGLPIAHVHNQRGPGLWWSPVPTANLDQPSMKGKYVVVTGANVGLGKEDAVGICVTGAKTIMACRDVARCDVAAEEVRARCRSTCEALHGAAAAKQRCAVDVETIQLDLSQLAKVDEFVATYTKRFGKRMGVLVNNAGMQNAVGNLWHDSANITEVMGVNHFAVVYLTQKCLPLLLTTPDARIVSVSSALHASGTLSLVDPGKLDVAKTSMALYGASKAGNVVHARHLARLLQRCGEPLVVFSLHPGVIRTELHRSDPWYQQGAIYLMHAAFAVSPWQGAQNTIHLATSADPTVLQTSGAYYSWFSPVAAKVKYDPPAGATEEEADDAFMKLTATILKIKSLETCADLNALKA